jgi:hypothetical protein
MFDVAAVCGGPVQVAGGLTQVTLQLQNTGFMRSSATSQAVASKAVREQVPVVSLSAVDESMHLCTHRLWTGGATVSSSTVHSRVLGAGRADCDNLGRTDNRRGRYFWHDGTLGRPQHRQRWTYG